MKVKNHYIEDNSIDLSDTIFIRPIFISGHKTNYYVTIDGNIIRVGKESSRPLKHHLARDDYHQVCLYKNGVRREFQVHRLVAEAFIPNPKNKSQVNHIDGNIHNNHMNNLEWVTPKENIHHAWKTGLAKANNKCDNHPNSIYTNSDIEKVCVLLEKNKLTYKEISEKTGVSYTVVKQIRNHLLWVDISKNFNIDNYTVSARNKYKKKG